MSLLRINEYIIDTTGNYVFNKLDVTANLTAGNANLGNLTTSNYFVGNGSLLTGISAGSTYANSNVADYLPIYTGNLSAGNANISGSITTGSGSGNISGANYVVANYFTGILTTAAQPNITSVGNLTSLTVTGNASANYFIGNGSQLTGLPASYSNTNVAAYLPTYTGNFTAGNANISGSLVTGTITTGSGTGNISGANYVIGNYFSGNGSLLTSLTGANVTGYVPLSTAANTAATVTTAAQPNITSVGSLTSLVVSGDATVAGNLTVSGNTEYTNVTNLYVKDPIIEMGGGANGAVLSSNDGKDRGTLLHYYTTSPVDAFMGWDNSNSEFGFGSNVSISSEVVTFNSFGNIRAGYFIGNGATLTSVTGANVTGYVPNANIANTATTAGTVTTAAQPNITSVGTLSSLTVSGLITATGTGIKTSNIQDSTGTITITTRYGNIAGDAGVYGNLTVGTSGSGNVTASYFIGDGSQLTGISGTYSNSNVAAYLPTYTGNLTAGNANVSGTMSVASITTTGSAGNITGANYINANFYIGNGSLLTGLPASYSNTNVAAYLPTYTGNVTANYFIGDGSLLTGLPASYSNANVASYLPTYTGNLTAGNANISGNLIAGNLTTSGSGGNLSGANYVISNYFSGNGSLLTSLTGANVTGYVPLSTTANVAGTVTTASQPNITSVGTLTSITIGSNGNISMNGVASQISGANLVSANYFTGNGSLLTGLPASYSNTNVAAYLPTYTGNVSANYFIGNGATLTYITGANVSGYVPLSTAANTAGTVTIAAQPNITSVGTLTSVTITSNGNVSMNGIASQISGANLVSANYVSGNGSLLTSLAGANVSGYVPLSTAANTAATVTTASQPNITSVGTLTGLTSNGSIDFTNTSNLAIGNISNLYIPGGSANYVIVTNGSGALSWAAQSGGGGNTSANVFANIISDTFTGNGVATTYTLSVTPTSINETTINYNGIILLRDAYSLSGANVTFDSAPANGSYIEVTTLTTSNASQYATTGKAIAMAIVFGF
jgi:hypothetical protein